MDLTMKLLLIMVAVFYVGHCIVARDPRTATTCGPDQYFDRHLGVSGRCQPCSNICQLSRGTHRECFAHKTCNASMYGLSTPTSRPSTSRYPQQSPEKLVAETPVESVTSKPTTLVAVTAVLVLVATALVFTLITVLLLKRRRTQLRIGLHHDNGTARFIIPVPPTAEHS